MGRDIESKKSKETIKFLCSYGGKILLRPTDGKLRYAGGLTRVLAVERSTSFAELMVKLGEFCGYSVTLRCQLPNGDLETLISTKSDEDLANIIEVYDGAASGSKIRAILSPPNSLKKISPSSSVDLSPKSPLAAVYSPPAAYGRFIPRTSSPQAEYSVGVRGHLGEARGYPCHVQGNPRSLYCASHFNCWHGLQKTQN